MSDALIKVLLVEDNPGDARLLRETLAEADPSQFDPACQFDIVHVGRIRDALSRLGAEHFDVVLLDLWLTDGQGLDTFIRVHERVPDVPIVVMTGIDDEELAVKAVQRGAHDYLIKGQVNGNFLVRSLRFAIERHRLQSALRSLSLIDDLTRIYNRHGFFTLAEKYRKLAFRMRSVVVIIFVSVENLKPIHDRFGPAEGNLALVKVAEILQQTFRESDILARLEDDVFAVLLLTTAEANIESLAARLQEAVRVYNAQGNPRYSLALRTGFTRFEPQPRLSAEEFLAKTDKALYDHKHTLRKP